MRIGKGRKNDSGGLTFDVIIPFLRPCTLILEKVENPGERSPHWHVIYEGEVLGKGERCGALWRRVPNGGGDAFLSGYIESPLFPSGKLEIAVFTSKESSSQKDMTWRPRGDNQDRAPEAKPPQKEVTGASVSDDDDIPF